MKWLFRKYSVFFNTSFNFELFVHLHLSLSYVWIGGVILFELIVSDNLKMNERNYFRFYFCHTCEGTILDLQMVIFVVKIMCTQWDTINNVVTVVKQT